MFRERFHNPNDSAQDKPEPYKVQYEEDAGSWPTENRQPHQDTEQGAGQLPAPWLVIAGRSNGCEYL